MGDSSARRRQRRRRKQARAQRRAANRRNQPGRDPKQWSTPGWTERVEVPDRPALAPRHFEAIQRHAEQFLGPMQDVIHEKTSELVHVDILRFPPQGAARPYWTLITSGMSDAPMWVRTCEHRPIEWRYGELVLCLPAHWSTNLRQRRAAWPYLLLQELVRVPHSSDTWLGYGHTWEPGGGINFAPGTRFAGAAIVPPATLPARFRTLTVAGRRIEFLGVMPLFRRELDYKLRRDFTAFAEKVGWGHLTEVVDLARPCLVGRQPHQQACRCAGCGRETGSPRGGLSGPRPARPRRPPPG